MASKKISFEGYLNEVRGETSNGKAALTASFQTLTDLERIREAGEAGKKAKYFSIYMLASSMESNDLIKLFNGAEIDSKYRVTIQRLDDEDDDA